MSTHDFGRADGRRPESRRSRADGGAAAGPDADIDADHDAHHDADRAADRDSHRPAHFLDADEPADAGASAGWAAGPDSFTGPGADPRTAPEAGPFTVPDAAESDPGLEPAAGPADSYWQLSRMPLTSLVFTLPLVLAYEGGVLLLGRGTPRNGADVWLRQLLDGLGFSGYFLLPTLTVLGLLAWQHLAGRPWRFDGGVLLGMALECFLWAGLLLAMAQMQGRLWDRLWQLAAPAVADGPLARIVGFCGAGLYEEVLFRLLLLPASIWLLRRLGAGPAAAGFWAVVATSLLFSLAHYVGPLGDRFGLFSFTFRALAGGCFALLFLVRGFGIGAGTHACYDLLVGLS